MKPLFFQHLKYPNQLKKSIAFSGVPSLHIKEPQNPDEAQKFIAHKRPDFVLCAGKIRINSDGKYFLESINSYLAENTNSLDPFRLFRYFAAQRLTANRRQVLALIFAYSKPDLICHFAFGGRLFRYPVVIRN